MFNTSPIEPPNRRFVLELRCHGDSRRDMLDALAHLVANIKSGVDKTAMGGFDNGGHYVIAENPTMNHEQYEKFLMEWNARRN